MRRRDGALDGAGPIRVAVVEAIPLLLDALVRVLDVPPVVVEQAVGALQHLDRSRARGCVVVVDEAVSAAAGAVEALTVAGNQVLVLSSVTDRAAVDGAIAAGARGYLPKVASGDQIGWAVRTVARGDRYVAPSLAASWARVERATVVERAGNLTRREREVLALLADGKTDDEIARALHVTTRTVHSYLDRIRAKTGRRRRADLTRLALTAGAAGPGPGA